MATPFATVTDPLALASTLVSCIDTGGIKGFAPANEGEIADANGYPKQYDVRGLKQEGTVRYNPEGALTFTAATAYVAGTAVAWFGQTCGNLIVTGAKEGETNNGHETLDVTVKGCIQKTLTHTWPTPA